MTTASSVPASGWRTYPQFSPTAADKIDVSVNKYVKHWSIFVFPSEICFPVSAASTRQQRQTLSNFLKQTTYVTTRRYTKPHTAHVGSLGHVNAAVCARTNPGARMTQIGGGSDRHFWRVFTFRAHSGFWNVCDNNGMEYECSNALYCFQIVSHFSYHPLA